MAFTNTKLVGFGIENDLKSLKLTCKNTEDLKDYYLDENQQPYSLKDLARDLLKENNFQCGVHSAISDARITRKLYYFKKKIIEKYPVFVKYPDKVTRTPRPPYIQDPLDVCTCNQNNAKKKRKEKKKKGPPQSVWYISGLDDTSSDDEVYLT